QNDAFPETVKSIVDGFGVPIELLELELTENIVMEDLERAERLCRRLKDLGFRIAIDDFGSGYSSLGTLQNLPIDEVKIDQLFFQRDLSDFRNATVVYSMANIAKVLG
ncbi:EAL domain-containing protein, partial [Escherichia coli]|nr:EAL domain-containing protein [Escherichia coli]